MYAFSSSLRSPQENHFRPTDALRANVIELHETVAQIAATYGQEAAKKIKFHLKGALKDYPKNAIQTKAMIIAMAKLLKSADERETSSK